MNTPINLSKPNLGIGNSTGLGMAPFIVNHPTLLNNWILARETALKKIREIKHVKNKDKDLFLYCLKKSLKNITSWSTDSEFQKNKIKGKVGIKIQTRVIYRRAQVAHPAGAHIGRTVHRRAIQGLQVVARPWAGRCHHCAHQQRWNPAHQGRYQHRAHLHLVNRAGRFGGALWTGGALGRNARFRLRADLQAGSREHRHLPRLWRGQRHCRLVQYTYRRGYLCTRSDYRALLAAGLCAHHHRGGHRQRGGQDERPIF